MVALLLFVSFALLGGGVAYVAIQMVRMVRRYKAAMENVIAQYQLERQLLTLQKQIVEQIHAQTVLQCQLIETKIAMAMNTITAAQLLRDKQNDPEWAQQFDAGRSNAQFN